MSKYRKPLNKKSSARKFSKSTKYTKAANLPGKRLQRGGQRM